MKPCNGEFQNNPQNSMTNSSLSYKVDKRMYTQDILASISHVKMLGKNGIIPFSESELIKNSLSEILEEIQSGNINIYQYDTDICTILDKLLFSKIGSVSEKLNIGRTRKEQYMLDLKLFLRDEATLIENQLISLENILLDISRKHLHTIIPSIQHEHQSKSIPVSYYFMSYFQMFKRDIERMDNCIKRINILPLSSSDPSLTSFSLDRHFVAADLGFESISENSLDAISDRDFIIELAGCISIIMMHINRISQEILLLSTTNISVTQPDTKNHLEEISNPHNLKQGITELSRSKSSKVFSNLVTLFSVVNSMPLSCSKHFEEDTESIIDSIDIVKLCLSVFTKLFEADILEELNISNNVLNRTSPKDISSDPILSSIENGEKFISSLS